MKKILILFMLALFLTGCATQQIKDIKNEEHIGEQVRVHGTVSSVISLGPVSGFLLKDKNGDEIAVGAKDLPAKGDELTVSGVLLKDSIFQYYIKIDE